MRAAGVWAGLANSPFLADVDHRDRDGARIAGAVLGGLVVGAVAALASMILILALYVLAVGQGGKGADGLRQVVLQLQSAATPGLKLTILELLLAAAVDGLFLVGFVAMAALLARRPFHHYVTAARQVRWRLLAAGVILSLMLLAPAVAVDRLFSGDRSATPLFAIAPGALERIAYGLSALLLIPAAAAEELFFRGWLTRQTAAFSRRPAVLIGLTAVVFSAAHFDFSPDGFLTRALMGAGFAYMTLRLGGIEFSTGVHAANNILIVLFLQPVNLQIPTASPGLSLGALLADIAMVVGYVAITEAVARLGPVRRLAGVRLEELSASGADVPRC
jgi:membrane protease YdiL (CAAX protease family)